MAQFIFKLRRGPASEWTADNPTLREGEPGFEIDTGNLKIGNGITSWNDLDYYPPASLSVAGVASVDGRDGIVTLADLYAALAHAHAQSDVTGLVAALGGKSATGHGHVEADVTGLVTDLAGKAATVHTHAQADVTGLVSDLADKAAAVHTHAGEDITSGKISSTRLNVGTGSSDVSAGDHDHGGGGGGSTLAVVRKKIVSGNFAGSNTSGAFIVANNGTEDLTLTIPAVVDDYVQVSLNALFIPGTMRLEYVVLNAGSIIQYGSTNTGSPAFEGDPSLYMDLSFNTADTGADFVVTAPMLNAGNITLGIVRQGSNGTGQIFGDSDYPCRLRVHNHGQATIL